MERNTIQKKEIIAVLENCYTHPTIKELCLLIKSKNPNIGQATVYRTVNKLVDEKIVRRLNLEDGVHYDYNRCHQHFYCHNCHKVFDVFLDEDTIDNLLSSSKLKDYMLDNLVFEGICSNCKK